MQKQVVIIHGGTSFESYAGYLSDLRTKTIRIEKLLPRKDWKDSLASALGDEFLVLCPRMPNSTNARYDEWKLWFERIATVLEDNVVLIGHSLGGIFLAKYLAENVFPRSIQSLFLIAAPFGDEYEKAVGESLVDFILPSSLEGVSKQVNHIILIHSNDDEVVPFSHLSHYQEKLENAKSVIFQDRGHFNQSEFPEIINLIKNQR